MNASIPSDVGVGVLGEHELNAVSGGDGAVTMTAIAMAESGGNTSPSTSHTFRTTALWGCRMTTRV